MNYFLDTSTCIHYLKGTFLPIDRHLRETSPELLKIPSAVKAELLLGARKSSRREQALSVLEQFFLPFEVVPFGEREACHYADIRDDVERIGHPIGANDLVIAATVRASGGTLVTHDVDAFRRVKDLKIEDWTT